MELTTAYNQIMLDANEFNILAQATPDLDVTEKSNSLASKLKKRLSSLDREFSQFPPPPHFEKKLQKEYSGPKPPSNHEEHEKWSAACNQFWPKNSFIEN
jgi:hypothetical protein